MGRIHCPRVADLPLPHILLGRVQFGNPRVRALGRIRLIRPGVHALMSALALALVRNPDLRVWMSMRNLYAAHCCSIFSAFVYNPLIDCIIGTLGLLDHLLPVLLRWIDWLVGQPSLRSSPWSILTSNVPVAIDLLRGARLCCIHLLVRFPCKSVSG